MNADRGLFHLTILLAFTVALENLFEVLFGFNSPLTAYRLVTIIILFYLIITGRILFLVITRINFLIISVFLWGVVVALARYFSAPVDFSLLLTNLILLLVNYTMYIFLSSLNWNRRFIVSVIVTYNLGLVVNLIWLYLEGGGRESTTIYVRESAFFSNPNSLGFAGLFGILSSYFLLRLTNRISLRLVAFGFIIVNILLIDNSASRAAAIVGIIVLFFIVIWHFRMGKRMVPKFVVVVSALLAFLYIENISSNALDRQRSREDRKVADERQLLTVAGFQAFVNTNYMGLGLSQFKFIANFYPIVHKLNPDVALDRKNKNEGLVTHNSYVQILAECGLIGFCMLIGFWITKIWCIWKNRIINLDMFFFQLGIAVVIVMFSYAHVIFLSPLMWFFLSFIFLIDENKK